MKFPAFISLFLALATTSLSAQQSTPPWGRNCATYYVDWGGINIEKNQVWSVSRGFDDFMYFAMNDGLGLYDGVRWEVYSTPDRARLRGLYYDPKAGRLYSCGVNEFGYWKPTPQGRMEYTRLYKNENLRRQSCEFWRICQDADSGYVWFQAHEIIYRYDPSTDNLSTISPHGTYGYMYCASGHVYVQDGATLYMVGIGGAMQKVCEVEGRVINLFTGRRGELVIAVERLGMFTIDGDGKLHALDNAVNALLSAAKIVSCQMYGQDTYLVGTTLSGLMVLDDYGKLRADMNNFEALPNTSVLSMETDAEGNVWLGLDAGIARIDFSSRQTYIRDKGLLGNVQAVLQDGERLLVGSNKGLFSLGREGEPQLIAGSLGPVWGLHRIDGHVLVLHDRGLMEFESGTLSMLRPGGILNLVQMKRDKRYFIGSDYQGISLFELRDGRLEFVAKVQGFSGYSRHLAVDKDDRVWVMTPHVGFTLLDLSQDKLSVDSIRNEDLPLDKNRDLLFCEIDGDLAFYNADKAFRFNAVTGKFECDDRATSLLGGCGSNPQNLTVVGSRFWYQSDGDIGYVERAGGEVVRYGGIFGQAYGKRLCTEFFSLQDGTVVLGFQNGLGFYNFGKYSPKRISLRRAQAVGIKGEKDFAGGEQPLHVPFGLNTLRIYPLNLDPGRMVDYRIPQIDRDWTTVRVDDFITLSGIPPGSYTFEMRNRGQDGGDALFLLRFSMEPPWYICWWMMCLYVATLCVVLFLIVYYFRRKHLHLRGRERERRQLQQERFERENLLKEKRISELETDQLRLTNRDKDKQLAHITMNAIRRGGMLAELKTEAAQLAATELPSQKVKSAALKIVRRINEEMSDEEDWNTSQSYFNAIYDGMLDRLLGRYPNLSQTDLKLCVYIKLNLGTKEIADLMGISVRSVEMARYRLRKKLGLSSEQSIGSVLV